MRCLVFFTFATLALAAPKPYNPRIIGGQEATPHSFPYQALMVMLSEEGRSWYCGGALISQLYVITAAHCVANAAQANVILGAHRYAEEEDSQVLLLGTEITLHENYDSEELINDIALIQLESPVTLSPAIQPIPLPTQDSIDKTYVDALCTATGWGVINSTQTSLSDVLNFVQLRVIENEDCVTYFGPLESSILCTSGLDNRSLCSGDSGGPLVTDGVLIGVGSFVAPNCPNDYPSGFSRVTSFLDWIIANTDIEM